MHSRKMTVRADPTFQSLLLANDDSPAKVDVCIAFHPSFLVEADLKNITSVPCAILKGSSDDMLSDDQLDQVCVRLPQMTSQILRKGQMG